MNHLVFVGFLLSEKGVGPTEARIGAITKANPPPPENAKELRSFRGIANYTSRFIPQFATLTDPLHKLLNKDVAYDFGPEQEAAFAQVKKLRPTPLPDGPWQDLAVDLMGPVPSGHSVLAVVDYYSRF